MLVLEDGSAEPAESAPVVHTADTLALAAAKSREALRRLGARQPVCCSDCCLGCSAWSNVLLKVIAVTSVDSSGGLGQTVQEEHFADVLVINDYPIQVQPMISIREVPISALNRQGERWWWGITSKESWRDGVLLSQQREHMCHQVSAWDYRRSLNAAGSDIFVRIDCQRNQWVTSM